MIVKKISLFLLLFIFSGIEMNIKAEILDDTPRTKQHERRRISRYGAMYEKFLQQVDDNKHEYAQARELCEQVGNCDDCPRFQKADAEKEDYEEKVQLIEYVNQLHAKLRESGLENGFDRQRTIRKIIYGW
jgi:hypothetical protein